MSFKLKYDDDDFNRIMANYFLNAKAAALDGGDYEVEYRTKLEDKTPNNAWHDIEIGLNDVLKSLMVPGRNIVPIDLIEFYDDEEARVLVQYDTLKHSEAVTEEVEQTQEGPKHIFTRTETYTLEPTYKAIYCDVSEVTKCVQALIKGIGDIDDGTLTQDKYYTKFKFKVQDNSIYVIIKM